MLWENYAEAWLKRQELRADQGQISREYVRSVKSYIENYLTPAFRGRSIREVTEGHIEDLFISRSVAPKTANNILGVLHKILSDAYRRWDIHRIPDFPKIEVRESETNWLTEDEQYKILAHIKDLTRRTFFLFLMKQAWRPGEARALKWERVNLAQGVVVCAAAMDQERYRECTKERDVRVQPLHPEVQAELEKLPRSITGFVFTYRGKPFRKGLVFDTWRRAARKAGINVSCYQGTRHSLASQAINAGVDKALISKFLGHKDARSTDRYAILLTESLKRVWGGGEQRKVLNLKKSPG